MPAKVQLVLFLKRLLTRRVAVISAGVRQWYLAEKRFFKSFFSLYCLQRLVKEDYIRCCMLTFFYLLSAVCLFLCALCAIRWLPRGSIGPARRPTPRIRQVFDPNQLDALGVEITQHSEKLLGCGQRVVGHAAVALFSDLMRTMLCA